jgi:DNA-binding NarL/FixJ family response regulator
VAEVKLRVLLADDHHAFRGRVRALIDSTPGVQVAGEAATGMEAVDQAISLQPDVILMDVNMPGLNGPMATREIVTRSPDIGVVIFTANPVGDVLFPGLHAGARGFLLKDCAPQDIVRAIQAVGRGEAIFAHSRAGSSASSPRRKWPLRSRPSARRVEACHPQEDRGHEADRAGRCRASSRPGLNGRRWTSGGNDVGHRTAAHSHAHLLATAHRAEGLAQGPLQLADPDLTHVTALAPTWRRGHLG